MILALGTIAIARLSSSAIEADILDSRTLPRILVTLHEIRMKERQIFPDESNLKFIRVSTIIYILNKINK